MTTATPSLPSEICPRCDGKIFRQAAQTRTERSYGSTPPVYFGLTCPYCHALLLVEVLSAAPLAFRFTINNLGGQP